MDNAPASTDLASRDDFQSLRSWVARRLRSWFSQHARPLPWRRNRDPFAIWVSEVMLQQTQASAVVPYFERFLQAFPTVTDLARADEQAVLKLWEGLGYYRRARDLHRAAQRILTDHGGAMPRELSALQSLPGFGRYTAGAVASQAYDTRAPIIEANSRRLWARFFGYQEDLHSSAAERWLWNAAESLLPPRRAGDFNQAVMELGALLCTPRAPACGNCPLKDRCWTRRHNAQERIPAPAQRKQITEVAEVALVIRRGGEVLLVQRPDHGRWPKMWEFPHAVCGEGESRADVVTRLAADLTGLVVSEAAEFTIIKHSVTRFRITLVCMTCTYQSGQFKSQFYEDGRWLSPERLAELPISTPQRRLAAALAAIRIKTVE